MQIKTLVKWKKWLLVILLAIITFVVLGSGYIAFSRYYLRKFVGNALQNASSSSSLPKYRYSYVIPQPGEVVIHFKTTLSLEDINTFLSKNSLKAIPASTTLNIILQSKSSDAQQQLQTDIEKLKAGNIIESCQEVRQLPNSYANVFCVPNLKTPLKELNAYWILEMSLLITPSSNPLATYVIKVPIGQENDLVAKLIKLSEVQSALAPK